MSLSVVAGILLLLLYWAWIGVFFARVRPGIMNALGRRLRVRVAESTSIVDAGTYGVDAPDAPLRKTGAVLAADFVVLLVGTVGVAALLFVPAFLVAESGALLPPEGKLTGRSATLSVASSATMPSSSGVARIALDASNVGREALRDCRAGVDGYTARNGYLNGSSPRFDLAPGARHAVAIELSATRPPAGAHRFRVKLECANERLAVADAALDVR
jgi:hypothetical protein